MADIIYDIDKLKKAKEARATPHKDILKIPD